MIDALINLICRIIWPLISVFEKGYWYIRRNLQKQSFIKCGTGVHIGRHCHFTSSTIILGNDVYIGEGCRFQATLSKIIIGNHIMFGPDVTIHGGNHRIDVVGRYMKEIGLGDKRPEDDADVIIEDDVWIGGGAIILKGVHVGEGAVIGAGSVITKSVPPYTVTTGGRLQSNRERWNSETVDLHRQLLIIRKPKELSE